MRENTPHAVYSVQKFNLQLHPDQFKVAVIDSLPVKTPLIRGPHDPVVNRKNGQNTPYGSR
jgi:hypothetical protein